MKQQLWFQILKRSCIQQTHFENAYRNAALITSYVNQYLIFLEKLFKIFSKKIMSLETNLILT